MIIFWKMKHYSKQFSKYFLVFYSFYYLRYLIRYLRYIIRNWKVIFVYLCSNTLFLLFSIIIWFAVAYHTWSAQYDVFGLGSKKCKGTVGKVGFGFCRRIVWVCLTFLWDWLTQVFMVLNTFLRTLMRKFPELIKVFTSKLSKNVYWKFHP